jgi:hypothetical protein
VTQYPQFKFIYDFGDWWSHTVTFEMFFEAELTQRYPGCMDGKYAAPPEDCGGPHGFEMFKKAVSNPKNKQHKEMSDWYAATNFDRVLEVDTFRLELTNLRIGRRQKPRAVPKLVQLP